MDQLQLVLGYFVVPASIYLQKHTFGFSQLRGRDSWVITKLRLAVVSTVLLHKLDCRPQITMTQALVQVAKMLRGVMADMHKRRRVALHVYVVVRCYV